MAMSVDIVQSSVKVLVPYSKISGILAVVHWVKAVASPSTVLPYLTMRRNTTYEAVQCVFYTAVNEVAAKVHNGIYSESVLQEHTEEENGPEEPTFTLNGTGYYWRSPYHGNYSPIVYKPPFAVGSPNLNDTFVLPSDGFFALSSEMLTLGGIVTTDGASGITADRGPISLLYQSKNVTRAMENLAHYMTIAMRANDSMLLQEENKNDSLIAADQTVVGITWQQKQVVIVRWAWLALPISLLVLAILFFLAVMYETAHGQIGVWQSSPLALFFHVCLREGVDKFDWCPEAPKTVQSMEKAARGLIGSMSELGVIEVYPKDDKSLSTQWRR